MKNWNVDPSKFKSKKEKRLWELSQLINYGLDKDERLSEVELKKYWRDLKTRLDPERARMIEYLIWKVKYSLPINNEFWRKHPGRKILQASFS